MSENSLITPEMVSEWEEIRKDRKLMVKWQHACREAEPLLFIDHWERTVRGLAPFLLREVPGPIVIPGLIRTFGQIGETLLLMGYFFGRRRYAAEIAHLDPDLAAKVKVEPSDPDDGGFDPADFSL